MRISNNMVTYNFLTSLNKSLERQNAIQEQLSDGKTIHRASDDPVKAVRALRFHTNETMNEQFTQNLKDAQSWMETTDGALQDMSSVMIHAKELAIKAVGSNPPEALSAIADELDGMINHMVQVGNTQIGDRYVFAGQQDKTKPFERVSVPTDAVVFKGDGGKISFRVQGGLSQPDQDSVNVTGEQVFGQNVEVLNHLIELKDRIAAGDTDWVSSTGMQNIDEDHSQILSADTALGARMSTYEMTQNLLEQQNTTIMGDVSANEDLDIPRAIIDFKTSENVYKTALSVGARIMPPSLVDFLR